MGKIICKNCDARLLKKDLRTRPQAEADEGGVYIVFPFHCPFCDEEIIDFRLKPIQGYKTYSDDPYYYET